MAPVLVGSALAWHSGHLIPEAAGLCLAFGLLIQIATNFANDYYDFVKGADTAARVGPRRAVASGWVSPGLMHRAMTGTFALAFAVGVGLLPWGGPWLLAIGVSCIVAGICYTGGPYPLGYHGLGDLFVFLYFGLVAVMATFAVQAGHVSLASFAAAVPIGLLAANILVVNNYRDADTDALAGKRTTVVRFGKGYARSQHALSLAVAFAMPVVFVVRGYGWACLLPLVLIPMALAHMRRLKAGGGPAALIALLGDTGKFLALYAILFSIGLAVRPALGA